MRTRLAITHPDDYRDLIAHLTVNSILLHRGDMITPQIAADFLLLDDDDGDWSNGTPHWQEICAGFSAHHMPGPIDCNSNGVLDRDDIAAGTSLDCNLNGRLDECELAENDCNANGVPDDCDLASGTSSDCNLDQRPDECGPSPTYGWTRTIGGPESESLNALAVDRNGHTLLTGTFYGELDFDPGPSEDVHSSVEESIDVFVTRLSADGSYAWTRTFGGTGGDRAGAIAVDGDGRIYITGSFVRTVDFNPGPGVDTHGSHGFSDVFVTQFQADGSYGWTRTIGGSGLDVGQAVAVNANGEVFVTGYFFGDVDFDPTAGQDWWSSNGESDGFVVQLHPDGSFGWARAWGGPTNDSARSVAAGPNGTIAVVGYFVDSVDFDPGPGEDWHTSNGQQDAFVTTLLSGGTYHGTRTFGGILDDDAASVAFAPDGALFVAGVFNDLVDFDPGPGADEYFALGYTDVFVLHYAADGSYAWTRVIGGSYPDTVAAVAIGPDGHVYVGGEFIGLVDFDPPNGADQPWSLGTTDIFVTQLGRDGSYGWTRALGNPNGTDDRLAGLAVDSLGFIRLAGRFGNVADFDPTLGLDLHASQGGVDGFVSRWLYDATFYADCNGNSTWDGCDIAGGDSPDANGNGVPDECDGLGDLNCDESVDFGDVDPFVLALVDPTEYHAQYPDCNLARADCNGDGTIDFDDIDVLVSLLAGAARS